MWLYEETGNFSINSYDFLRIIKFIHTYGWNYSFFIRKMLKSYPKLFNGKQTSFETEILPRKKVWYNPYIYTVTADSFGYLTWNFT